MALAKITAPKIGITLRRERLLQQLDQAAQHKLVWIAAPGGSGKTTLAVDWLQDRGYRHLWFQVDAGDQDLAAFFSYLATAAEQSSRARRKLPRFTPEYALGLPAFSRNFFRDVYARLKPPACLVFDNYQDVGDATLLDTMLANALDELPEGITVLVLSRSSVPAALARHDTQGQVARIDAEALNLTPEEEAALVELSLGARKLRAADLSRLRQATHGWIAGVLLALREVQSRAAGEASSVIDALSRAPDQDPTHVFDYFAGEIMARLDGEVRDFLYAVALLPTMTVAQCERLTDNPQAKAILRRLVHEHFFITRRGLLTPAYEFHPLFRQFLLAQARDHVDIVRWRTLQRRAGQLLAETGDGEAVTLLSATQDWPTLADLIRTHGARLEKEGRTQTLRQWVAALPEAEVKRDPWLLYWQGIGHLFTDPFRAYELFQAAWPQFKERDDALGLYWGWIGATSALFFSMDDMEPAPYWIAELEALRARHPRWPSFEVRARVTGAALGVLLLGDCANPILPDWVARAEKLFRFVPVGVVRCFLGQQLGTYYSFFGKIGELNKLADQLTPLVDSPNIPEFARLMAVPILIYRAWQAGQRDLAEQAITNLLALEASSGVLTTQNWFHAAAAIPKLIYGDLDAADRLIQSIQDNLDPRKRSELCFWEFLHVWRALLSNDPAAARSHAITALAIAETMPQNKFLQQQVWGAGAQVLIETGEYAEAARLLAKLRELGRSIGNQHLGLFWAGYLEAYLLDRSGAPLDQTLAALSQSFSAAARNNWVAMVFWDPKLITRLCVLALQHGVEPEYAKRLIRLYGYTPPADELIERWPWPWRIYTLGRFSILKDDQPLELGAKGNRKPLELLKTLIAMGARAVNQARLVEALWPDSEGDAGQQAFETTLHRLRALLGKDAPLQLKGGLLTLDARHCWVDAWAFERFVTELEHGHTHPAPATLSAKLFQLYRGSFLANDLEMVAIMPQRERLRGRFLRALNAIGHRHETIDEHDAAIGCYLRAIEVEPLAEAFYSKLMSAYLRLGRHAEGLAVYERCRNTLHAALGVKPSRETEVLRASLEAAGRALLTHNFRT